MRELARALDFDQAGGLQFLEVVRECRGAHVVTVEQPPTGQRSVLRADLLEDAVAPWLREHARNLREAQIRQRGLLRIGHVSNIRLGGTDFRATRRLRSRIDVRGRSSTFAGRSINSRERRGRAVKRCGRAVMVRERRAIEVDRR
jgi:hypothetical protein